MLVSTQNYRTLVNLSLGCYRPASRIWSLPLAPAINWHFFLPSFIPNTVDLQKRLFDTGHTFIGFRHGAHVVFLFRTRATGLSRRVENREKQHTQRVILQNGFLILVTSSLGFATERTSSFFFERLQQRVCPVEWKIERNSTRNEWI